MDSILTSIKKMLGIDEEYKHFDPDIVMHINSVFMDLNQLGVGPADGFMIEDDTSIWTDFLPDNTKYEAVKSYMNLRVRLLFDPPSSSAVIEAMKRDIDKWEWRFSVASNMGKASGEGIDYNKLKNLPSINGRTLIGNYDEIDPTIDTMSEDDIDDLWDDDYYDY